MLSRHSSSGSPGTETPGSDDAPVTLTELVMAARGAITGRGLSIDSIGRLGDLMGRFAAFAERGCGVVLASDVTEEVVEGFVGARSGRGQPPAVATMHLRRCVVRLLFAEGRGLGLVDHDPTLDIRLPPRSSLRTRPLTDDEVMLCRSLSVSSPQETRDPVAWVLAEATARSSELARIRIRDLDLEHDRVWIAGGTKTEPRWGQLSGWARTQIGRRLRSLQGAAPETRLVCPTATPGVSATSSASTAIARTLRRAGLGDEPDVRPSSVAAWVGAQAHARGARIEQVAAMLGIRSLDRTAEFIGWHWYAGTTEPRP
jgi:integrase/recombinase XerC